MKRTAEARKKGLYMGAAVGLLLFALIGLLPSSYIGGVLGLRIAGHFFGMPLDAALLARVIVGATMAVGVLVTGAVFVLCSSLIGWLLGSIGMATRNKTAHRLA